MVSGCYHSNCVLVQCINLVLPLPETAELTVPAMSSSIYKVYGLASDLPTNSFSLYRSRENDESSLSRPNDEEEPIVED